MRLFVFLVLYPKSSYLIHTKQENTFLISHGIILRFIEDVERRVDVMRIELFALSTINKRKQSLNITIVFG